MRGLRLLLSAGVIDQQHPANLSGQKCCVEFISGVILALNLCPLMQSLCFSSCVQPAAQMLSMWCWTGTWWQDRMRIPPFLLSRTFWFFAMSGEERWGLITGNRQWWASFGFRISVPQKGFFPLVFCWSVCHFCMMKSARQLCLLAKSIWLFKRRRCKCVRKCTAVMKLAE